MLNLETIKPKFKKDWWIKLEAFFKKKDAFLIYQTLKQSEDVLPKSNDLYSSFWNCPLNKIHTIVVNQNNNWDIKTMWENISINYPNLNIEEEPLQFLEQQGVLFINYNMTTSLNNKHLHLWKPFIQYLFKEMFNNHLDLVIIYDEEIYPEIKRLVSSHHLISLQDKECWIKLNQFLCQYQNLWIEWTKEDWCKSINALTEEEINNIKLPF